MNRYLRWVLALTLLAMLIPTTASANLCVNVRDAKTKHKTKRDVDYYEHLFRDKSLHGNRDWNEIITECNRKRDNNGSLIRKLITKSGFEETKSILKKRNLAPEIIRGRYNYFGKLITQQKYRYILSRKSNVWKLVLPYKPMINDAVKNRIDISDEHAANFYAADQITGSGTSISKKPGAIPIAQATQCTTSTFFKGKEHKYDGKNGKNSGKRDRKNKHISLGKIEYSYDGSDVYVGCRVKESEPLFYERTDASGTTTIEKVIPKEWVYDNFVRVSEEYWSIPGVFELKILLKGKNESRFDRSLIKKLKDSDYLKIRFGTKFLQSNFNQVYKVSPIQFNNFSTMTVDRVYHHEVGHALGLDDEYGGKKKKNSCHHSKYSKKDPTDYKMCTSRATDQRSIYHYIATSRYLTTQVCKKDGDCGRGKYCNRRLGTNRCLPYRSSSVGDKCVKNKECKSNKCQGNGSSRACVCGRDADCGRNKFCNNRLGKNRCLAYRTIAVGQSCSKNKECKSNKCQGSGKNRACVCNSDNDCGSNKYCNKRLGKNRCLAYRSTPVGKSCTKNKECKSNKCQGSGSKRACVCGRDSDCGSGQYCNKRLGANRCLAKASKSVGQKCSKNGECKSGKCQGSGSKRACVCNKNSDCASGQYCNNRLGANRCLADSSKSLGQKCSKNGECKSGKCQGSGSNRTCVCSKDSDCSSGKCKRRIGKNRCK